MPCPNSSLSGSRIDNSPWENFVDTINFNIPSLFKPNDLGDLVLILQMAETANMEVKAIGSGWSIENIAISNNWVIDISELNNDITNIIDIDRSFIADCVADSKRTSHLDASEDVSFVHIEAGIKIIDLNRFLQSKGLSMITLGGAQGQTLAGAISTSTHGSDINETPLPDLVEAIHLVSENGQEFWIESDIDPFTDDDDALLALLSCSDTQIIRDDNLFKSVQVSLGRFGVIYSYVVRVKNTFRTVEWANDLSWPTVRTALLGGISDGNLFGRVNGILPTPIAALSVSDTNHIYFDLAFSPRSASNCWVRRRWLTTNPTDMNLEEGANILCTPGLASGILVLVATALDVYAASIAWIPFVGLKSIYIHVRASALRVFALTGPSAGAAVAECVDAIMSSQLGNELTWLVNEVNQMVINQSAGGTAENPKRGVYWQVNSGVDESAFDRDCFNGNSLEMIFDTNDNSFITFLDSILELGPTMVQLGYISVRFSQPSAALLSMHNVTSAFAVSVEVTSLHGMDDSVRWLETVQDLGIANGGVPHWGQKNDLSLTQVRSIYGEKVEMWKNQLERIVGTSARFSNDYTRQRGLEPIDSLRRVRAVIREDGSITHLCNEGFSWSPVSIEEAIAHVNSGAIEYYVESASGERLTLEVRTYLTTTPDHDESNNLRSQNEAMISGLPLPPNDVIELEVNAIQLQSSADRSWVAYIGNIDDSWAVVSALAEAQVQLGLKQYYTIGSDGSRMDLEYRRYLATPPNDSVSDNLEELPDC